MKPFHSSSLRPGIFSRWYQALRQRSAGSPGSRSPFRTPHTVEALESRIAPAATVTLTVSIANDTDGDGVADPGETLLYTATVNNTGPGALSAMSITELLNDPNLTLVGGVNVGPLANNDSFNAVGNTLLHVGGTAGSGPELFVSGGNLFANDFELLGDTIGTQTTLTATGTFASAHGGSVTLNADGTFTYISKAGDTGTDSFTYTLRDRGVDGVAGNADDLTSTATVNIALTGKVWYVDNSVGSTGTGISNSPFKTIGEAQTASGVNDIIYVANGTGTYGGTALTLKNGQALIGEGVALVSPTLPAGTPSGQVTLKTAGTAPTLTSAGTAITLAQNDTLRGFTVGDSGIDIAGNAFGILTVDKVTLNGTGKTLDLVNGTFAAGSNFLSIASTSTPAGQHGMKLDTVHGVVDFGSTTISGSAIQGIFVTASDANITFGNTSVGTASANSGSGAGTEGIRFENNTGGTRTFGSLTVQNTQGIGFLESGDTGATTINGAASFSTIGGDAINISSGTTTNVNVTFNSSLNINGATGDGIELLNHTGTFSAANTAASAIQNVNGTDVLITNGTGAVTIGAAITNTTGGFISIDNHETNDITMNGNLSSTGGASGISVTNVNSGLVTFGGLTKTLTTNTNTAVNFTNNTGATVQFAGGGLAITTTSGAGFIATGGGTINVGGTNSTINTTTGQILNMSGVSIGLAGVTFATMASSGTIANTGVLLNDVDGSGNTFSGGNVTIAGTSGAASDGLAITGGSAATFTFASATISNTGDDGIEISGANGAITFTTVNLNGMTDAGIVMNPSAGSGAIAINGGTIGNTNDPGGIGVGLTGGNGNVTIAATITKTTAGKIVNVTGITGGTVTFSAALSATGAVDNGINVSSNSGGTINFSGGTKTLTTGAGTAVNLATNTGATINFTGGNLAITTTSGAGFNATGGGTVNVTGTGSIISSPTGTALNVTNTTIGTSGLTFQSISSNGSSGLAGIVLDNTGNNSGLTVTGTGTAGSGGTIANKTGGDILTGTDGGAQTTSGTGGTGIFLRSTKNAFFSRMQLNDFSNFAIYGNSVTNFSLKDSVINGTNGNNNAGDREEAAVRFDNLLGNAQITGSTISGGAWGNIALFNTGGTLNRVTLDNDTFGLISATIGNDNVHMEIFNSATANISVTNSTFAGTRGDFFEVLTNNNATSDVVARGNTFQNGQVIIPGGGTGVSVRTGSAGNSSAANTTFDISNNLINGAQANAFDTVGIFVAKGQDGGSMSGVISGNTIGPAKANANADGIFVRSAGSGVLGSNTITVLISNNTITGYGNAGIHLQNNDGSCTMNATVIGNSLTNPNSQNFAGVFADNGATATDTSKMNLVLGSSAIAAQQNTLVGSGLGTDVSLSNFNGSTTFNLSKAGSASGTVTAVVQDDNVGSPSVDTSGGAGAITLVTAQTVRLIDTVAAVLEDGSAVTTYTFLRYGDTSASLTANFTVGGTATFATDYTQSGAASFNASSGTVTFGAGSATAQVTIDPTADGTVESNETVTLTLAAGSYTIGNTNAVTATIYDDDTTPLPLLFAPDASAATTPVLGSTLPDVPVIVPEHTGGSTSTNIGSPDDTLVSQPPAVQTPVADSASLSQAQLDSLVGAAIARWEAAGITPEQDALLHSVTFSVADLPGWYLGEASTGHVTLDKDAAGNGWFVDSTPLSDEEFANNAGTLGATANGGAAGRLDALTTVVHELGHQLGLDDSYVAADANNVMYGYLHLGERRLAAAHQADGAVPHLLNGGADFLFGSMSLGSAVLAPSQTLTVQYLAQINPNLRNGLPPTVSSQLQLGFTDGTAQTANSNIVTTTLDSLTIGNLVWNDTNQNGVFNSGTETGIDGVVMNLYVDADNDNVADTPGTPLLTTTTAGGGLYSFAGLLPGNYIVQLAQSNFNAGGPLQNGLSSPGVSDPDNGDPDVDNDDNGAPLAGQGIVSPAITLAYNNEPTSPAFGGGDTNNTLDFGVFFATLSATLSGGKLTIADTSSGMVNNITATLVNGGVDLQIADANEVFQSAPAGGTLSNGGKTLTLPLASVTNGLAFNLAGAADQLTLDLTGGDFIDATGVDYDGSTPLVTPGDKLVISGGSQGTVTYNYTNAHDGSVVMSNFGTVRYAGLEPITNTGSATDIIFNLPAAANSATLADDGTSGNGLSRLSGATFEQTDFMDPSGSVTIHRGNTADTLTVNALPDFHASLTIGAAGSEFGAVTFAGAVTLAANKNLSVDASGAINLTTAASDLATSGTGSISMTTAKTIVFVTGSSLAVVNGDLSLNANTSGAGIGNDIGISVTTASITSSGSGNIVLNAQGGDLAGNGGHTGVSLSNGATINSIGTGTITITGTGGTGTTGNIGVSLSGSGTQVSSVSGKITIDGTGGSGTNFNAGFIMGTGPKVMATGSADVQITGTGGGGGVAGGSQALSFDGTEGAIGVTTVGGNIALVGDSIAISTGTSISAGTNTVALHQKTNGTLINIGGADANGAPDTLGLTDAELDFITAGTVVVGDANSGAVTITGVISPANYKTLSVGNAASFTASGGFASDISSAAVFEKMVVAGALSINTSATFTATAIGGFVPAVADSFTIIDNTSAGTTTGNFSGKPEGTTVPVGGVNKIMTYAGGNGNDVVLIGTAVSVAVAPSSVGESSATGLVYTFTRVGDTTAALPVNFSVGGLAAFTNDYSAASAAAGFTFNAGSGTITIPAGSASATLTLTPVDDAIVEADETATLTVTSGSGYGPTGSPATGTITDDDSATVTIAKITDGAETNTPAAGKFRVTQTAVSSTDTVLSYSIGGTAQPGAGNDYSTLTGTVTILAGQTTADIDVTVLNDAIVEGTETVIVTLSGVTGGDPHVTLGAATAATVSITDDDTATVTIAKITDGAETNTPTAGKFRVTQSAISSTDTVLSYSIGGTATPGAGNDYSTLSGTVTILAGQTTADIDVTVLNDAIVEGTETVTVTLSGVTAGDPQITLGGTTAATVNISDDDTATVTIAKISDGAETNTPAHGKFQVTQSAISSTDTVLSYSIGGTAAPGSDYSPLTGTVTILAGQTTADIDVTVLNDAIVEGTETVTVTLSGTAGDPQITLGGTIAATVDITDNDTATVSIAKITDGAEAGSTAGKFRVTQTAISSTDTVLSYSIGGTATSGSDFSALSGTVTILAGQTTADIDLSVLNDALVEGTETVIPTLSGVTSGDPQITLGGTTSATANIIDNESATIDFASASSLIGEAGGNDGLVLQVFITSDGTGPVALARDVTVNVNTTGGTAISGTDYTLPATVTFLSGDGSGAQHTANLAIINDALVEGTETADLGLTIGTDNTGGLVTIATDTTASHTTTITDNDTATIGYATVTSTVGEGAGNDSLGLVLTITANGTGTAALAKNVTLNVTNAGGGTATGGGTDYSLPSLVTFTAGALNGATQTPNLAIVNDASVEGTETANLGLAIATDNTGGQVTIASGAAGNHTATITDNDTATIRFSTSVSSLFEVPQNSALGLDITFNVNGTGTPNLARSVIVNVVDLGGTATAGGVDYTLAPQVTFNAGGGGSTLVQLNTVNDSLVEGSETVNLGLSIATDNTGGQVTIITGPLANNTTTILDNDTATIGFATSTSSVGEGAGNDALDLVLTINANGTGTPALARDVTLNVTDSGSGTAIGNGTDFSLPSLVTFNSGALNGATKTANLAIVDDGLSEGSETANLGLAIGTDNTGGQVTIASGANSHVTTIVDNDVDLKITKVDSADPVTAGSGPGNLTYTVTLQNVGLTDATNISISELFNLPSGVTLVSGTPSSGTFVGTNSNGSWTLSSLAHGATATLGVTFTVSSATAAGTDVISNTATVTSATEHLVNTGDDSDTESTSVIRTSDLAITKTGTPALIVRGQTLTYTITVTNAGASDATGATVTDNFPIGLTNVSWNAVLAGGATGTTLGSGNINESINVPAGGSVTYTVNGTVAVSAVGPKLSNTATVSSAADPNTANNSATADTNLYQGIYVVSPGVAFPQRFAPPAIRVFDAATGNQTLSFLAYPANYRDSIRVAVGDLNGDGFDDIITTTARGTGRLRVFDGLTGAQFTTGVWAGQKAVFNGTSNKGAFVAVGDINGDGHDDVLVGSALGGGRVRAFDGVTGSMVADFLPFGKTFTGGVRVALGDTNGDGKDDLILGQGFRGHAVKVISGLNLSNTNQELLNFVKVGSNAYRGGVSVAAGDLDGDGKADLIIGRNNGTPTQIETFSGIDMHVLPVGGAPIRPFDFNPAKPRYALGVRVAAVDVNFDGIADIIAASGGNNQSRVKIYDGATRSEITARALTAYPSFPNSALFVAGSSPVPVVKPPQQEVP